MCWTALLASDQVGLCLPLQALRENLPQLQAPGNGAAAGDFALPNSGHISSFLDRRNCEAKLGALSQNPIVAASLTAAALTYNGETGGGGTQKPPGKRLKASNAAQRGADIDFEALHAALTTPTEGAAAAAGGNAGDGGEGGSSSSQASAAAAGGLGLPVPGSSSGGGAVAPRAGVLEGCGPGRG